MPPSPLGLQVAQVVVVDTGDMFDARYVGDATSDKVLDFFGVVGQQTQWSTTAEILQQRGGVAEVTGVIGQPQ